MVLQPETGCGDRVGPGGAQRSGSAKRPRGKTVKLRSDDPTQSPKALPGRGVWGAKLWENPFKPGEKPRILGKSPADQQI